MGSQKIKETLQTLKKLLDDEDITEQDYKIAKTEALHDYVHRPSEGEGGDRGQAPDAVVGTSSGRGREVSGQGSDTQLVATAATSSAPRGSEGVAAERSGAGPKASEGGHDDDDVGRVVEVWRLPKTIDAVGVKEMFRGVGAVTEAVVHQDPKDPKARATVTFADSSQAERAVRKMHGKLIEGIGDTISPCNHMYSYTPPTHSITHSTEKDAPGATLRANSSTSPISGGERGENPPPGDPSSAARRRSRRSPVSSAVGPRPPSSRHTEVTSLSVIPHGTMSLNLLRSGSTLRATP